MGERGGETSHSATPLPVAAIALAALLWAIAAVVARDLFDAGVPPIHLVEARAVLSALGLALLPVTWRSRRRRRPDAGRIVIALGLSIALVNAAYYTAIARLAVAVAIVLQYLGPGLVVAWNALARRRRPSARVATAVVVAFVGVVLVSEVTGGDFGAVDLIGLGAGLASAVFFAAYTLQSEEAAAVFGPIGAVFRAFVAASVFWFLYQLPQGLPSTLFDPANLPSVAFVGIAGTLMPFLLYVWAIGRIRSERAVIAATLEPLFAGIVAWVWLGQMLSLVQIAGGALILGAVVWLQLEAAPNEPARVA
ncbi:MAG: EamA family transporter [Actinomycetota bacterium]|nr:EamA family transporter [Actinomycetota bacterium]